jgi:hypothetical protein
MKMVRPRPDIELRLEPGDPRFLMDTSSIEATSVDCVGLRLPKGHAMQFLFIFAIINPPFQQQRLVELRKILPWLDA